MRIRSIDMRLIDDLFEMGGGYVLDFNNRTFAEFFQDELGIDIDDLRYAREGTSKAKRLRYFLRTSSQSATVAVLRALWEYRQDAFRRRPRQDQVPDAESEFKSLLRRLGGKDVSPERTESELSGKAPDSKRADVLKQGLIEISQLEPQPRGFAFERFLRELFNANGLEARASFRIVGEQIDGSFQLSGETYLLEARWRAQQTGSTDLHAFNGKVEEKAAWSRGLFVSHSGFTEDGLIAFGRGKRVVCMDGLDLYEMLDRGIAFADVVSRKVRHAAETGLPLAHVRGLFP